MNREEEHSPLEAVEVSSTESVLQEKQASFFGKPLTVGHDAPLRLVAPVKLGLKNIKAVTRITYTADEPADYWAKRGYSHYDGI
jgi:DMSO/TMAO reductase YedYZ molybdopterin-dependent catalytic subunit